MNFSVAAPAGLAAPALLTLRGADPAIDIPAGHVLHSLLPASLFSLPPGGVVGSFLPYSLVAGCIGSAMHLGPAGAVAGSLHTTSCILQLPLPIKLEMILQQLLADGFAVRMFSSAGALADAIVTFVMALVSPPAAAYTTYLADTFATEPPAVGVLAAQVQLVQLTSYGGLSHPGKDFAVGFSALSYFCYGLCLTAQRDVPAAPARISLQALDAAAVALGLSSPDGLSRYSRDYLTAPPPGLMLFQNRTGPHLRIEELRERVSLSSNVPAVLRSVLGRRLLSPELQSNFPELFPVLQKVANPPSRAFGS